MNRLLSLAHTLPETPNWQQFSDLFVCFILESMMFVALKKRIPPQNVRIFFFFFFGGGFVWSD